MLALELRPDAHIRSRFPRLERGIRRFSAAAGIDIADRERCIKGHRPGAHTLVGSRSSPSAYRGVG